MKSTEVGVVPFTCRFSSLTIFAKDSDRTAPDTLLKESQPFSLQASVEFVGSGAIALLCLTPSIQVDFYAKSCGRGGTVDLGTAATSSVVNQAIYTPTLELESPAAVGLEARSLYQISALLRIGAPDCPALICGVIEDLMVEIYDASKLAKKSTKSKSSLSNH
ncbi:MAG: hypothetical protein QNJ46_30810 [Leptolyngbyaceae cyanobacterium MO_188.B28]|nr:hypothetical protein [Leptolyngbyaceae cyanobacterium MO_188.B28]